MLQKLSGYVFSEQAFPEIAKAYERYVQSLDQSSILKQDAYKKRLKDLSSSINNIVQVMMTTASSALAGKLQELEQEKTQIQYKMEELSKRQKQASIDMDALHETFVKARSMFATGTLRSERSRELLALFVDRVLVFYDRIEIRFNLGMEPPPTSDYKPDKTAEQESSAVLLRSELNELLTVRENRTSGKDTIKREG